MSGADSGHDQLAMGVRAVCACTGEILLRSCITKRKDRKGEEDITRPQSPRAHSGPFRQRPALGSRVLNHRGACVPLGPCLSLPIRAIRAYLRPSYAYWARPCRAGPPGPCLIPPQCGRSIPLSRLRIASCSISDILSRSDSERVAPRFHILQSSQHSSQLWLLKRTLKESATMHTRNTHH